MPLTSVCWTPVSGWPRWASLSGSLLTFLTKHVFVLPSGRYFPCGILLIFTLVSDRFLQKMRLFARMSQRKVDDKVRSRLHFSSKGSRSIVLL